MPVRPLQFAQPGSLFTATEVVFPFTYNGQVFIYAHRNCYISGIARGRIYGANGARMEPKETMNTTIISGIGSDQVAVVIQTIHNRTYSAGNVNGFVSPVDIGESVLGAARHITHVENGLSAGGIGLVKPSNFPGGIDASCFGIEATGNIDRSERESLRPRRSG